MRNIIILVVFICADLSKSGVFSIENYRHLQHSDMMMVENANGRRMEVPRGMYHYTEQNNEIDSNYRLPTLNTDDDEIEARSFMMDLLRGGTTKTSTNDNEMMGIYIPMPIQPINIQINREKSNGMLMSSTMNDNNNRRRSMPTSIEVEKAFRMVQLACLNNDDDEQQDSQLMCDQALEQYANLRW